MFGTEVFTRFKSGQQINFENVIDCNRRAISGRQISFP